MKLFTLIALPVILLALFVINTDKEKAGADKQKGICWVGTPQPVTREEVSILSSVGVTWISQTPFAWQQTPGDTSIRFEKESGRKPWWGESYEGIATTTRYAKEHSIKTIIKPHIWLRDSWPGEIEMQNEFAWKQWFKNYSAFILSYAALAQVEQAEILCIGTELQKTLHRPEWFVLIREIRSVYQGKLTYAANFNEFERVPFWKELDFIGIQAYFPLTRNEHPSVDDLTEGWQKPLAQIQALHDRLQMPIIFTEIGYKSTSDGTINPWQWPSQHDLNKISETTQANAYEAFFKECWHQPWLAGVYFWKWYPQGSKRHAAIDFTPQGKAAENVMKQWFINK